MGERGTLRLLVLNFDLTRAARSLEERTAIVRAVEAAPAGEPETDWIEWKSAVDLTAAAGRFAAAKSILGFGNRQPDYAARYARGCAYFLVGVEPGNLIGTAVRDPADIEQCLSAYVAKGEPQWSVDYIHVDGVSVLFLTVEAPQQGDPIFTLRKAFDEFEKGAVFVRGNGRTARPTPEETARLTQRAASAGLRVDVSVQWRRPPLLRALAPSDERAGAWVEAEAVRLERPPERSTTRYSSIIGRDRRPPQAYDAAVARYLEYARFWLRLLACKACVEREVAVLDLRIENGTDANFPASQVTLQLPADVVAFLDVRDVEEAMADVAPPLAWGQDNFTRIAPMYARGITIPGVSPPRGRVERDDDAVRVTLPPVHVRPGTPHDIDRVYLILPESFAGSSFEVAWRVTSTGASGDSTGTLNAPVETEMVREWDLVEPQLPELFDDE